jgi:hypothetical protein
VGSIVVFSDQTWLVGSSGGLRSVLIDGKGAGSLPQRGIFSQEVPEGWHQVRIRRFWLSSPIIEVQVPNVGNVALRANDVSGSFVKWFFKAFFTPTQSLNLQIVADAPSHLDTPPATRQMQNRVLLVTPLLSAGLLVTAWGISDHSHVLEVVGVVVAALCAVVYQRLTTAIKRSGRFVRKEGD